MTPKQYAESLRLIADWYEQQADTIPMPSNFEGPVLYWENEEKQAALAREVARALGDAEKVHIDEYFTLKRRFGEIELKFLFKRSSVCIRRVVDRVIVPERIIPTYIKEIVEWDCSSILAVNDESQKPENIDRELPESADQAEKG